MCRGHPSVTHRASSGASLMWQLPAPAGTCQDSPPSLQSHPANGNPALPQWHLHLLQHSSGSEPAELWLQSGSPKGHWGRAGRGRDPWQQGGHREVSWGNSDPVKSHPLFPQGSRMVPFHSKREGGHHVCKAIQGGVKAQNPGGLTSTGKSSLPRQDMQNM